MRTVDKVVDKLAKLIDVKTIVTFTITAVFAYLAVKREIPATKVYETFLWIIAFYFGMQYKKKENVKENENEAEKED